MICYSAKIKFYDGQDEIRLINLLQAEREVFNFASEKHFGSKNNSIKELHAKVYKEFREMYGSIPAQVVVRGMNSCLAAYRSIKSNKHKIDKAPVKKKLSIRLDKRLYSIKNNNIKITSTDGKRIKCYFDVYPQLEKYLKGCKFGDPLIYVKDSQIWISFPFNTNDPQVFGDTLAIGVDLGKRRTACTSDGRIIKSTDFNKQRRKIRHLKDCLKSKGTRSAKKHLKKLKHKEANVSKNATHLVANEILKTKANVVIIEDLSSIKKPKNKKNFRNLNGISQVPFRMLRDFLVYKARILGKEVETVNPYMTSQDDYRNIKNGQRKGCRYHTSDGIVFDADIQAAINIALKSKHPISFVEPIDGSFKPIGQAIVNRPKTLCGLSTNGPNVLVSQNKPQYFSTTRQCDALACGS